MPELIVDTREIRRVSLQLKGLGRGAPAAVSAALNRAATHAHKLIKKEVSSKYEIQQSIVNQSLTKKQASKSKLEAEIISKGHSRGLMRFKVKPSKPPKLKGVKISKRKQTQVKVLKQEGYKQVNIKPGAFVQKMRNALNVWQRKGRKKTDVKVLRSLSVPQMIGGERVINTIKNSALDMMKRRLEHEIDYRLQRLQQRR